MKEKKLLNKWVKRLGLSDWTIKLYTNCDPKDMEIQNSVGCTTWTKSSKLAKIEIIDPKYYGKRIVPFNFEKTLVHELLHLKNFFLVSKRR